MKSRERRIGGEMEQMENKINVIGVRRSGVFGENQKGENVKMFSLNSVYQIALKK